MSRELPQFYTTTGKRVAAFTDRTAARTIPRLGAPALILLWIGLFLLFPACRTGMQLRAEQLLPWEMIGAFREDVPMEDLLSIDGLERVSPMVSLDAQIRFGEYKLDCPVQAVHSGFLNVRLLEGALFSDDANMPFLLLNKAAANSFSPEITVSANTNVTLTANGQEAPARICGVFDDGRETPRVYMSYALAQKAFARESEPALIFALPRGRAEPVAAALQRKGISVTLDGQDALRWTLMEQQLMQYLLTSIGFLVCSAILIRTRIAAEDRAELQSLLLSGLTMAQGKQILQKRLTLTYAICILTSSLVAALLGLFSMPPIALCTAAALAHAQSVRFQK